MASARDLKLKALQVLQEGCYYLAIPADPFSGGYCPVLFYVHIHTSTAMTASFLNLWKTAGGQVVTKPLPAWLPGWDFSKEGTSVHQITEDQARTLMYVHGVTTMPSHPGLNKSIHV